MVPVVEPDARSTTDTEFPLVTQAVCVSGSTAAPAGALPTSTGAVRDSASTTNVVAILGGPIDPWLDSVPHAEAHREHTDREPHGPRALGPARARADDPIHDVSRGLSSLVTDIVSPQPLT